MMAVWELTPVARPDDPGWQGRSQYARVVVRAATAADARVAASTLDTPEKADEFGDQHPRFKSGLLDEKLYLVRPAAEGDHPADGEPGVLLAEPRESEEYT